MPGLFVSCRSRIGFVAVLWTALAIGMYRRAEWVTWIWPWNDGRLTYVFLASIAAAVAAPLWWMAITDEPGAVTGLAIDAVVIGAGLSLALAIMAIDRDEPRLLTYAAGAAIAAAGAAWAFVKTRVHIIRVNLVLPRNVRFVFIAFIALLLPAGIGMISGRNGLFPWVIPSATSIIIGAFFLGASTYFAYALWKDLWVHGAALLIGFLAYDAVLFWPYFGEFLNRNEQTRLGMYGTTSARVDAANLAFYLGVLVFSALIAIYYLAIDRQTRFWTKSRD